MKAADRKNQGRLLHRIVAAIQAGGQLTESTLEYIDAVLFSPEPDRLSAFLNDDTNSERDSLLDLIFYPDQAVQLDLEPLLEAARYTVVDEKDLHDRLMARAIDVRIKMPDGRPLVRFQVPDLIKSQYLARLYISRQMDPHVAAAIEKGVSAALGPMVKVRLRNAGVRLARNQSVFLSRFFERMPASDSDYLACLDLVLPILAQTREPVDAYELLAEHKRSLFRSVQQANRFETLLQRSNMETLMLQGFRAPHVAGHVSMHHMRLIDLICYRVFGKTETFDRPIEEPFRQVADLDTPEAAVRLLLV